MSAMFRAIVWKELRANLKWGVVLLLGMAIGLIYKMRLLADPYLLPVPNLDAVVDNLKGTAVIGAIVGGLLIGAAQALAENRGDKWGFLAHRPASRSVLSGGKATAGILLYAIATGVPVAVVLSRMATPGYLPVPFDWKIALPVVANLLCGVVFYFAAFLTGMRQARWYASRALGIGAAVVCLGALMAFATAFWHAAAICAAGQIMVGTAAWSTFVAGGQYGAQLRIGRIATGLCVGLGVTVVACLVLVITLEALRTIEAAPREFRYSRYTVTSNGKFVKITNERDRIVVSDLDGRPLEQYRRDVLNGSLGDGVLSVRLSPALQATRSFQSSSWLFTPLRATENINSLTWHYVHRLGLIVAHDSRSRKLVGWMLALIEWPALESCPACSRKRVVTRERCEHCGEPFKAPPQDGTEIFEPMPHIMGRKEVQTTPAAERP